MKFVIASLLFVLGIYLAIRVLAALHRVIDLWYTIPRAWPGVLRGLLIWCGGSVLLAFILPHPYRLDLLLGLSAYLILYLAGYALWHLAIPRLASRRDQL